MKRAPLAALLLVAFAACAPKVHKSAQDQSDRNLLRPTYAPEPGGAATTTTTAPGSPSPGGTTPTTVGGGSAGGAGAFAGGTSGGSTPGASTSATTSASLIDPIGDLTPSPLDPPPRWADLAGGRLTRSPAGFELRVRLGDTAPATSPDANHTMNVASFYDVNGDGTVDYEVWANLADTGWGPAYFDDTPTSSGNRFGAASGVAVSVSADELILTFPLAHLGAADRFRWSLASEWGNYNVIGTLAAARDDAPDNDGAVGFPG